MTSPDGTVLYNEVQVDKVIEYLGDIFDRSSIEYYVLGEVAGCINNNIKSFEVPKVEIGIRKEGLHKYGTTTMDLFLGAKIVGMNDGFTHFVIEGLEVPVYIKVLKRKYAFLKNPKVVTFNWTPVRLPNPFMDYWASRTKI